MEVSNKNKFSFLKILNKKNINFIIYGSLALFLYDIKKQYNDVDLMASNTKKKKIKEILKLKNIKINKNKDSRIEFISKDVEYDILFIQNKDFEKKHKNCENIKREDLFLKTINILELLEMYKNIYIKKKKVKHKKRIKEIEKYIFNKIYTKLEKDLEKYKIPLAEQIQIKTKDPFFVLIGTILSSRTKDTTTSKVCNKLFKKVKSFQDLKKINKKELEDLLYGVGFYKQKTKYLKKLPKVIEKDFNNKIPEKIEDLIKLPGVGRKTANLVRSVAFNKQAICVDVHVNRIFNRLGLLNTKSTKHTEMKLRKILPKKYWKKTNYLFVKLGQNICRPRSPKCKICTIKKYCSYNLQKKKKIRKHNNI